MPQYLNILLQKSDPALSWGFDIIGGREYGLPLIICQVSTNSFSSQYLSKGDHIIQIEGIDASLFSEAEARSFLKKPSKSLDLLILKNAHDTPKRDHFALKSNDDSKSKRPSRINLVGKRNYKRTRSVPPKSFEAIHSELFTKKQEETITYNSNQLESNSIRGRSESPNFLRYERTQRCKNDDGKIYRRRVADHSGKDSDVECDREVARYCRRDRERMQLRDESECSRLNIKYSCNASVSSQSHVNSRESYRYVMPVSFDYYEDRQPQQNPEFGRNEQKHVSRVYLSPYDSYMRSKISKSLASCNGVKNRRQTSTQSVDKSSQPNTNENSVQNNDTKMTPPAPPPPPPPITNGGSIPAMRLKSEIPERNEPPAKIQSAMMKDKKPFTYTPGGIDLSEIKSPRMQRRIVRNAQTPDDIILPTNTTPVNTQSLPPSAVAAMMPQIAIPVFPQNGISKKSNSTPPSSVQTQKVAPDSVKNPQTPPPPPLKQPIIRTTIANSNQNSQTEKVTSQPPRGQVGSLYVPPVTESIQTKLKPTQTQSIPTLPTQPAFPTLREAPTPWLQKHQQQNEESVPSWVNRNKNNIESEQKEIPIYERKSRIHQVEKEKETVNSDKNTPASPGTRIIPIRIENSSINNQNSQRWSNDNIQSRNNENSKCQSEPETKPIQSRSFKVIQKITGSEDDMTDYSSDNTYNESAPPLNQLKKLQLNDDDRIFMNKVKSQAHVNENARNRGGTVSVIEVKNDRLNVDEDTFLHSETDPRYRGSAIPSRAFRILQNMTDSGQVIPTVIEAQTQIKTKPMGNKADNNELQRKYIPPSERQAEQDLRKYMGSSIPSRSFRMLQAMTATQESSKNAFEHDKIAEEKHIPYSIPNPWPNPPQTSEEVHLFWIHYIYLLNLVLECLPHQEKDLWNAFYGCDSDYDVNSYENKTTDDDLLPDNNVYSDYEKSDINASDIKDMESKLNKNAREELIITELIKDESENDVSLTVCIPLRKKRKTVEYHEEITLTEPINEEIIPSEALSATITEKESIEDSYEGSHLASNSAEPEIKVITDSKPDEVLSHETEHSSESSVDFWKEIIDEKEDVFYKRPLSERIEETDDETNSKNTYSECNERIEHGEKSYENMIDDNNDSEYSSDDSDKSDDSSDDENDSYNVYEFRSHTCQENDSVKPVELNEDHDPIESNKLLYPVPSDIEEDSGMTSDVPKDSSSELRKLTKYQRANTHSRLLKILIEEEKQTNENDLTTRKESLTLPLTPNLFPAESVSSSSGINSPMSPVANEKLVNELVQSLLKWNKGHDFRKLPPEKLREAAIKSLQVETSDTSRTSSPYLSDSKARHISSQETDLNYSESNYDSCEDSLYYPGFDVLPSRAFKNLQSGRSTPMNWPKCPLITNPTPESISKVNKTQDGLYKR